MIKFYHGDMRKIILNSGISFGGLYVGLSVAHETDASNWLLSCVTGLFIYIALVDIVSHQRFNLNYRPNTFKLF